MEQDQSDLKIVDKGKSRKKPKWFSPDRYSTADIVTIICCASLASIMLATTLTVLAGLFDEKVDNGWKSNFYK